MSVIIIGGGIGGLATAVALERVGVEAHVYERAPEIREVGAGFTIWSNAMKALRRLGLEDQTIALGATLRKIRTLSPGGKFINEQDLDALSRSCGAPSICIHRADLQRVLADAVDSAHIHVGKECIGLTQDATGVVARFSDGTEARGEIAIGADGIRSVVRSTILGEEPLRYAGAYSYRAIVEAPGLPADEAIFAMHPGAELGFFPFGREGRIYWFICPNAPAGDIPADFDHAAFLRPFAERLPSNLADIMLRTPVEELIIGKIFDRPPSRVWTKGRATLLGDSAHATTPNLGQGACMAIEDAVVLADALRNADTMVEGLKSYEERRRRRTAMIINGSWRVGRMYHIENRLLVGLRTLMFSTPFAGWIGRSVQRRLLSFEPPELNSPKPPL